MKKRRYDTPLKRGILAILARYPMKTRQMVAIPPSAILSLKGIARYGGVSYIGPLSLHVSCCTFVLLLTVSHLKFSMWFVLLCPS